MLPTTVVMCPVCGHAGELGSGPGGRPRASCRACGSLERHRALIGILSGLRTAAQGGVLLDVAPSPLTSRRLKSIAAEADVPYLGLDFDPGADNRVVTVQASLTDLPLPDASVGLLICFHVLEHIPDDRAAMLEIARTLSPSGVAVIQVPQRPDRLTDEDPDAPIDERLRRFGQADHVRYYGRDFHDRLTAAGLTVRQAVMGDLYHGLETDLFGIVVNEPVWLCTTGEEIDIEQIAQNCATSARATAVQALERVVHSREDKEQARLRLKARVVDLKATVARIEKSRDRAVDRERALRQRPDVRIVSSLARRARKITGKS